MIDEKLVQNIRTTGTYQESAQSKYKVLIEELGFNLDQSAEYVFVTGCGYPDLVPNIFKSFKAFFDHYSIDYTLLSKEYCCGYPISRSAIISKDESAMNEAKAYASEFILSNFRQAEALGAKSIVLFCAGCEPNYANLINETKLEVITYSDLLDRYFTGGRITADVDYYAGCYRFRRKLTSVPVNIEAAQRVLNKIEGLRVNQLDNNLCCFKEQQVDQLLGSLETNMMITICSGCYYLLQGKLKDKEGYEVKMLPEIVIEAIHNK
jgi:Fe-S oxidoreductase